MLMRDNTHYKPEDFLADETFTDYLLNRNPDSVNFWINWIKDNPQYEHEIQEAKTMFFSIRGATKQWTSNQAKENFAKLLEVIDENSQTRVVEIKKSTQKDFYVKILRWTASIAAILAIGFSVWTYSQNAAEPLQNTTQFQTDNQPQTISLPDGSIVYLNNHSSIALSKSYNKHKREIRLIGSAFFKVAKDKEKPFVVTSGNVSTTALGTSFYVYHVNEEAVSVALLEGKVRVEGSKNSLELLPGEKAVLMDQQSLTKEDFPKETLRNFLAGKIVFEQASLSEITTVLSEYFNIRVQLAGEFPPLSFTGKFSSGDIHPILNSLEFAYNIHSRIGEQTLTLSYQTTKTNGK